MPDKKVPTIDITPELQDTNVSQEELERINQKLTITSITPDGQDPLIYWYNCAKDAIDTIAKNEQKHKQDTAELDSLRYDKRVHDSRERRQLQHQSMPSIRDMIYDVERGRYSMTMSFTFTPYSISKGCDSCDQEE